MIKTLALQFLAMSREDPFGELEQLFDQFAGLGSALTGDLPVDVVETDEALLVIVDLPGRTPSDIDVQLTGDNQLQIAAPKPDDEATGRYVIRGRTRGAVSRSVYLPTAVDEEATEASYDRGVLTVRLGKQTAGEGTAIPVS